MCVYSHVCTHTCACSGQRSTLGVSLNCFMYLFLCFCETVSLMTLQCTSLVRLAGQQAPGICLCLPRAEIIGAYADMLILCRYWGSKLGSSCLHSSPLPTESSPSLLRSVFVPTCVDEYPDVSCCSPESPASTTVISARSSGNQTGFPAY